MAVVVPFHPPSTNWPPADCCRPDPDASRRLPKRLPLLGWIASAMSTYRRRRAAIRTLRSLDDRLLRDIGIRREDIDTAVDTLLGSEAARRGCVIATYSKMPLEQ